MLSFDKQTRQLVNHARTLGSGLLSVYLSDNELIRLCCLIARDLRQEELIADLGLQLPRSDYFSLPIPWFSELLNQPILFPEIYLRLQQSIEDFATYFKCLCELHKRRLKFQQILRYQPLSLLEQIKPRVLLEYGWFPGEELSSWLIWRKWLYDLDNRSAQETGYLFEPILAAAIGGIPYSASQSPIRRADNPSRGRQVDCLDEKQAYEFKMRVTIAASGQGRFTEEIEFARDCAFSGYVPTLLVLDPTPSSRLETLTTAYQQFGGQAYIGESAWGHLAEKAGWAMGQFIEKYIHAPFRVVTSDKFSLLPLSLKVQDDHVIVGIGQTHISISRSHPDEDVEI